MVNTLSPPISVLLSWPKPNYIDPWDQGPALFICCILFSILGVLIVSARIYSRLFLTRVPGSDDVLIVLGCLFTVGLSTLIAIANKTYKNGRHIWDVPPSNYSGHRLNTYMCEWFYLAAATCIKISILLFYRRLSVGFSKWFYWATYIGIIYNILVCFGFCLALVVICRPLKAYWLMFDMFWLASNQFECGSESVSLPLSGGLSMIGDLYATLLPMLMISGIPRSSREKLGLYLLFGLGFLSVISGIIRTYLLHRVINVDYDFLPALYYMWIVSIIELYFAIFAASAPALRPFFKTYMLVPGTKAKSSGLHSGVRSGTINSNGPWSPNNPWSQASSNRDRESGTLDIEKVGIAYGFPEEIQPDTHNTWVELQSSDGLKQPGEVRTRTYSRMISFPEEREPPIDQIAIAR